MSSEQERTENDNCEMEEEDNIVINVVIKNEADILQDERNEKVNKIKTFLENRYEPDDIIKRCMQIGVSSSENLDKCNIIDINKCVTRNEVVIIMYKTGDVYTMDITPNLTFQDIVDYILAETAEFMNENDKQYMLMLDEKSLCSLYPTTEQFLQTPIEKKR